MKLEVQLRSGGCADGLYSIEAAGFDAYALYWADAGGPLEDWTAFARGRLDERGSAEFCFTGGRAVPPEATHAAAWVCMQDDSRRELLLAPLNQPSAPLPGDELACFGVMSDLHISSRTGRIHRAMALLKDCDCILMAGDLTNDGLPGQFAALWECIASRLEGVPVLAVTGNHDYPVRPLPLVLEGADDYPRFQHALIERARKLGVDCLEHASGAFRAQVKGMDIFGLNAVSHFRRFVFRDGAQTDWLDEQLQSRTGRRLILCHAPLRLHNPNSRSPGDTVYLSRDRALQEMIDRAGGACFISGHTHVSLSDAQGCVELDAQHGNLYLNDSSVTRSALRRPEAASDPDWTDGAAVKLRIYAGGAEISARTLHSGKRISRGYYRLPW